MSIAPIILPAESRWRLAWRRLLRNPVGVAALILVLIYAVIALGSLAGLWGGDWNRTGDVSYAAPGAQHWLGTNRNGQDILARALYGTRTAFVIGFSVALIATFIGALLGAAAAHFGRWIDELVLWLAGVFDAIPFYLFAVAVAFALHGHPAGMILAMVGAFWTGTARLVRAEVLKLRALPFIGAARAVGLSRQQILWRHLLPNCAQLWLVQAGLVFVSAIKTEVILSFLGLGPQQGVSWGLMIAQASTEVASGQWWNFIAASGFMFGLVLAFSLLVDALQDALNVRGAAP